MRTMVSIALGMSLVAIVPGVQETISLVMVNVNQVIEVLKGCSG
jgi:hypothetical protein